MYFCLNFINFCYNLIETVFQQLLFIFFLNNTNNFGHNFFFIFAEFHYTALQMIS